MSEQYRQVLLAAGILTLLGQAGEVVAFLYLELHITTSGLYWIGVGSTIVVGGGIVYGARWMARSGLSPSRYPRIGYWCLAGLVAYLLLNIGFIATMPGLLWEDIVSWLRWAVVLGAGFGMAIGVFEARSIEQAIAADRAERQAEYLEEQRDNLELLNEVLRHDIRNNLAVINGYTDLLDEHVDEEGEAYLATVAASTGDAIALTQTARDLADVILQSEPEDQQVSLADTLGQQVEEIRTKHPDAVVTVEEPVPETPVVADTMLETVFRNLLQNAIQHNDKDTPHVTVTAREQAETVQVQTADNGPGVPEMHKEEIFGKGEKGLESSGTGIGLYLVNMVVERYGGDVWVDSNEPHGSLFVVELPVAE